MLKNMKIGVKVGAALAVTTIVGTAVIAQSVDGIDLGKIKAAVDALKPEAQQTVDSSQGRGQKFEKDAEELHQSVVAQIGDLKGTGAVDGGPIDFDKLIDGAADNAQVQRGGDAPLFIAFASLSMPKDSLRRLIEDTSRAGGVVVFRGFPNNSAKAFTQGMLEVVNEEDDFASIGIDPRLFRAFNVEAVPSFVVASSGFDPCDGFDCQTDVPAHDVMVGNVTVEYALQSFADGGGAGGAVARVALRNLKDSKK